MSQLYLDDSSEPRLTVIHSLSVYENDVKIADMEVKETIYDCFGCDYGLIDIGCCLKGLKKWRTQRKLDKMGDQLLNEAIKIIEKGV
jgi:hypothetical protein